jgi:hypothetical protein
MPSNQLSPEQVTITPKVETYSTEQVMTMFKAIKDRYRMGALNEQEYERTIEDFKFLDDAGRYWTVGAQSEAWYYHDGRAWVQGTPPRTLHRSVA